MTDQQKQAINESPISWRGQDCAELCTQAKAIRSNAYTAAVASKALGERYDDLLLAADRAARDEIKALGKSARGYKIWSYMALPAIERAVDAGAWDADAAVEFFTK